MNNKNCLCVQGRPMQYADKFVYIKLQLFKQLFRVVVVDGFCVCVVSL